MSPLTPVQRVTLTAFLSCWVGLGCTGLILGDGSPNGASAGGAGAGAGVGVGGASGVGAGVGAAGTAQLPADDEPVDFFRDIQPILGDYCVRCHGGVRELGVPKLNLQSRDRAAFTLGQAGNPDSSLLYVKATLDDPELRMPLGQPALPADKLNKLRRWIFQGAPWPAQWSFVPVAAVEPTALPVSDEGWIQTPVDRFVLKRLDDAMIKPSPEASKETLLRRVSLDLVGLPPTLAQVDAFVADASTKASATKASGLSLPPSAPTAST